GSPLPINLKYCDGGGCAGGSGVGLGPAFLDPYMFMSNSGDPGSLVVPAHELFHMIQFSYDAVKSDPAGAWVTEAQARAIQDLVCIDAGGVTCQNVDDDPTGIAPFYGQVNAYLGDTNRPINEISYTACLFWSYLCQEYGTNMSEPQLGLDFLEKFWDEADDDKDRDGIQVVDATLKNLNPSFSFKKAFKDFVIANYAKDLTGSSVPAKYQYVDETQPPGSYDPVALDVSENLSGMEQVGPMLSNVQKWGAVYHEVRPDSSVPYIQLDYSVDNGVPTFFCALAIKGGEIEMEIRDEGLNFEESFANNNYDAIAVVVAGLENDANFRFSINGTQPVVNILDPLTTRKAAVGNKDAPEKFLAKVEVLDPDSNPIEGIADSEFSFEIGPQTLNSGNIVTSSYVQGQYWFVIQAPTQTINTNYDFVASWSVLSDTETNAINYAMRSDTDNMLVIDRSGSMDNPMSKIADAKDAANLYVDSWREGDKIGVASFNCSADPTNLTLRDWNDTSRMSAHTAINGISAGGGTSIGNGLQKGLDQLIDSGDASHQWAVILLSDGNNTCDPNIQDFLDTYEARMDNGDQVPQVHTIAIGADANRP
ncbi:MAG: VWA domain-containing protein, partial [Candidatus Omnitrophica bacterium]|nr:VWA domain-containing protein [Candidatus Omnitrophota bacterium]